jgi:hypothetical protein
MGIEVAVLMHLLAQSPVISVVGTRGYQLRLPQKPTLPALRTQLIGEVEMVTLKGDLTNLFAARVQVDLWTNETDGGDGYTTARDGGVAIRNALMLTSAGGQVFSVGSPAEIAVSSVELLDRTIEYEPEEFRQIRLRQDFRLMFQELS